ncbi:MAG: hypothetical protein JO069_10440 [Verrucomicrobia bacterium]|nr:hypothetical protein [Verrucomicrobiota bacterium]
MKRRDGDGSVTGEAGDAFDHDGTRFEATVLKVQWRPCWSFAIEVEADQFSTLEPGQTLSARLGWFLVSSMRTGDRTVRFRGFGRPKLKPGERITIGAVDRNAR